MDDRPGGLTRLRRSAESFGDLRVEWVGFADFDDACTDLARRAGDPSVARDYEKLIPMFGVIWPCCRHLVHRILAEPGLAGERVLEWGCGLAIPSIVGASRGAHMTASDQHPDTAAFLARNRELNGVDIDYMDVSALNGRYDRVWMSDVLYFIDMPVVAADAFAAHLRPGGVGWLTDPGRPWLGEFEAACIERGLAVDVDVASIDGHEDAFLLEITWAPGRLDAAATGPVGSRSTTVT